MSQPLTTTMTDHNIAEQVMGWRRGLCTDDYGDEMWFDDAGHSVGLVHGRDALRRGFEPSLNPAQALQVVRHLTAATCRSVVIGSPTAKCPAWSCDVIPARSDEATFVCLGATFCAAICRAALLAVPRSHPPSSPPPRPHPLGMALAIR